MRGAAPADKKNSGGRAGKPGAAFGKALTGRLGEDAAATYLIRKKFKVLARNWRPAQEKNRLELDIVALRKDALVFVEVKTRKAGDGARLTDNFTEQKKRNLFTAARLYLQESGQWGQFCRFDLICVELGPDGSCSLEHYENVIELDGRERGSKGGGHPVGGGDSAWQPW